MISNRKKIRIKIKRSKKRLFLTFLMTESLILIILHTEYTCYLFCKLFNYTKNLPLINQCYTLYPLKSLQYLAQIIIFYHKYANQKRMSTYIPKNIYVS